MIRFYGRDVPDGEEWEFYDLVADPNEMKSIYAVPAQLRPKASLRISSPAEGHGP